mmetsp:Transcript_34769/g.95882  ORF Transcript_34769/g.95882 Transcript_34769/m.95882 type:complete len:699 (+) Transcript_34769:41-2137(+)
MSTGTATECIRGSATDSVGPVDAGGDPETRAEVGSGNALASLAARAVDHLGRADAEGRLDAAITRALDPASGGSAKQPATLASCATEQASGGQGDAPSAAPTPASKAPDGESDGLPSASPTPASRAPDGESGGCLHPLVGDASTGKRAVASGREAPDGEHGTPPSPPLGDVSGGQRALAPGDEVEIVGTKMNGSVGTVDRYLEQKDRWKVQFTSGDAKNFKAENLRAIRPAKRRRKEEKARDFILSTPGADEGRLHADVAAAFAAAATPADKQERQGSGAMSMSQAIERMKSEPAPFGERVEVVAAGEPVNLAGTLFAGRAELVSHIRAIMARAEAQGSHAADSHGLLEGGDKFLIFHLVMRHPRTAEKMHLPLRGIRYGVHSLFPKSKCFILVFTDGTEEPVSWSRCVKELFAAPGSATGDLQSSEPVARREAKRPRVETHYEPVREKTRAETGLRLLGELAAEQRAEGADRWEYLLKDEEKRCFMGHLRNSKSPEFLRGFYDRVAAGTEWHQPVDPRSAEPIPRKTAWMVSPGCTCTYRYGGVDVSPQTFPEWMVEVMQAYMPLCGLPSREDWPNSCNLNLYEDGAMSVGWHADDEKLFQGKRTDIRIVSLSLGHARTFELREDGLEEGTVSRAKCRVRLGDGDLCTMEGLTQKYYQHRVPKEEAAGPRINLTWRWVKRHSSFCGLCGPPAAEGRA